MDFRDKSPTQAAIRNVANDAEQQRIDAVQQRLQDLRDLRMDILAQIKGYLIGSVNGHLETAMAEVDAAIREIEIGEQRRATNS